VEVAVAAIEEVTEAAKVMAEMVAVVMAAAQVMEALAAAVQVVAQAILVAARLNHQLQLPHHVQWDLTSQTVHGHVRFNLKIHTVCHVLKAQS
jgi:hypothetical protein